MLLPCEYGKKYLTTPLSYAIIICTQSAGVMELADVSDSKSDGSDTVPVRPRSPAPIFHGLVAQLGERCVRNAEVEGSIPFKSTNIKSSRFAISRTRFLFSPNRYIYAITQNSSYVPLEEFNLLSVQIRLIIFCSA